METSEHINKFDVAAVLAKTLGKYEVEFICAIPCVQRVVMIIGYSGKYNGKGSGDECIKYSFLNKTC